MSSGFQRFLAPFGIFIVCMTPVLNAQNIFSGGNNDGFAKNAYSEPDPSTDIYSGGLNDGFAMNSYSEPDPSLDIYQGGIQDGFALSFYTEPSPNDIYQGGVNDGFASSLYEEPTPWDIFDGGNNDGFASNFFSEDVLPVQWNYFFITKKNGKAILEWGADREEKCLHYEILRSHDGKTFEFVGAADCQGKDVNNEYQFEDTSLLWHHIYYYKILQTDIDGEFVYSDVRAFVPSEPSAPEVYYRNRQIIVKTNREAKLRSVTVYDYTGRILCTESTKGNIESYSTLDCDLSANQLVIIRMTFDSFSHTSHMRIGDH